MMYVRIKQRQDGELKRDAFSALRKGTKLQLIQANMRKYYFHKFQKRVVQAWKLILDTNNVHRISLIK